MGKVYLLFFGTFLPVLTNFLFWQGKWTLGYHFMKFRHFIIFPDFLRSQVLSRSATGEATPYMSCL